MRTSIHRSLLVLGLAAVVAVPVARADGVPIPPIELYAGVGVTEWAHAEFDVQFGDLFYLLGRAGLAGGGDAVLGGGILFFVPLSSARLDIDTPTHALLLGLAGMYNPEGADTGWTNPRPTTMTPLLRDPLAGYGEATLGYGFHSKVGVHFRVVGGGLFDGEGFLLPMVRLSIGIGDKNRGKD